MSYRYTCPQHGRGCKWYDLVSNADTQGTNLGYSSGYSNGRDFAREHEPMDSSEYPISNCRGDLFALGVFSGIKTEWSK